MELVSKVAVKRIIALFIILALLILFHIYYMIYIPGDSFKGPLPPLTEMQSKYETQLRHDLDILINKIGERNVFIPKKLEAAADFIETSFLESGYIVFRQRFTALGEDVANIEVEIRGKSKPDEIVVVGAHYDSVSGSQGANDNGTGTVSVLALSRAFKDKQPDRTLRFVEFVNEEPPFFQEYQEKGMGSWVYARRCRESGDNIVAMLSLETMGCFSDDADSQKYPPPFNFFYPSVGNFILFVGNSKSRSLVHHVITAFRQSTTFPSEGIATFGFLPGIGWSDHWAFWQEGYQALMITDSGPFRYPYYHTNMDSVDKIDFKSLAIIVAGLEHVIDSLAGVR